MENSTYLNNNHLVKLLKGEEGEKYLIPGVCLPGICRHSWAGSAQQSQQPCSYGYGSVKPKLTQPAGGRCVYCYGLSISLTCLPSCTQCKHEHRPTLRWPGRGSGAYKHATCPRSCYSLAGSAEPLELHPQVSTCACALNPSLGSTGWTDQGSSLLPEFKCSVPLGNQG